MGNFIIQLTTTLVGFTSPFVSVDMFQPSFTQAAALGSAVEMTEQQAEQFKERADAIDAFFQKRSMPLAGYGTTMVSAAEKNGLDWRLLPAIAARESSGGKQACNFNPFGWGSCKIEFKSWTEAINTVAAHLGGNRPTTSDYYKDTTTKEKLHFYNGTVMPAYTGEVLAIMDMIGTAK